MDKRTGGPAFTLCPGPGNMRKGGMGFIRMKGVAGLVFVQDGGDGPKKHPCPDCHFCQWCSDNRCGLCLEGTARPPAGSSATGGRCRKKPGRGRPGG